MPKCPRCGEEKNVRLSHADGFWEKYVLSVVGWFPFRCRGCGRRFCRMGSAGERAHRRRVRKERKASEAFAAAEPPNESFEEVVEMLKRAEAEANKSKEAAADNLRSISRDGLT